jgi:glycosyltransferase involved in cell wall biosynthesis
MNAMPDPSVSVIIIAYNAERYLAAAIESVIAQTAKDWELLVVDDGSADGTLRLAQSFAAAAPGQIKVLQHGDKANHGMSATRNRGLEASRGRFVAFLDADDIWLPDKLETQETILRAHPSAGLTYGRALIWRSWLGAGESDFYYGLGVEPDRLYPARELFRRQLRNVDQTPTTSGSMMRLDLVREVGGFEPVFQAMFEDQVFFAKLLLRTDVFVSDATTFKYRQHPESASAQSAAAAEDDSARERYLCWLADYLEGSPYADERPAVVRALRSLQHDRRKAVLKRRLKRMLGRA